MEDAFDGITHVEMSDLLGTAKALSDALLDGLEDAGVGIPKLTELLQGHKVDLPDGGLLGGLLGGAPITDILLGGKGDIFGFGLAGVVSLLTGFIAEGASPGQIELTGPAGAAQAAVIALRFVAAQPPTAPHITYEFAEVWPGQTYLGLAIQHVRDWCSRPWPAVTT